MDNTFQEDQVNVVRRSNSRRRHLQTINNEANQTAETIKQESFNAQLRQDSYNAPWKRIIYREINIDSANNAVLYYPPRPTDTECNLFTLLFRLINNGVIKAYEYTDGTELFDKAHEIKFAEFLDRFGIFAQTTEKDGQTHYEVADADIPSDLVRAYYIKEEYYFDPINSTTDVRVLALCPILYDNIENTELVKFPLFWVKYDDIRFYLNTHSVMLSEKNNAEDLTLDSFFRLGLYHGSIYKTMNLRGLSLAQYCPTPDSLHREQERIEAELRSFESTLWSKNAKEQIKETFSETEKTNDQLSGADTARARRQQIQEGKTPRFKSQKKSKTPKVSKKSKTTSSKRSARSRF